MKNNTMKRVLAATLSVLTVAGTMPVNVGGFLTESSVLVANAEETVKDVTFDYTDTGVTSVEYDGTTYPYKAVKSLDAEVGKDITFHSTTKLSFYSEIDDSVTPSGEKGNYTYTFKVPAITEEITVSDKTADVTITPYTDDDNNVHTPEVYEGALKKGEDGKYVTDGATEITSNPDAKPKQGTKVTVLADTPFNVKVGQDANAAPVAIGTWDEKAEKYVLADYYIENDAVTFEGTAHVSNFEYTLDKNVLYVTDKAENSNIKNETAAWVKGYYQGKTTADGEGTNQELDGEDTTEVGPVELKTGGERIYDKNNYVDVSMQRVDKLLGWGGNGTKDDDLLAFKYKITKDGKAIAGVSSEGTVTKAQYETPNDDKTIGTTTFKKDEEGTINLFKAVETGHYEVTITVWGTDNTAAAFNLVYTFDIVSEELGPESFDLFAGYAEDIANNDQAEQNGFYNWEQWWDAENKIWLIEVPAENIMEDANKQKYVYLVDTEDKSKHIAFGVTARLKAALAAKYPDLVYGNTQTGYQVIAEQAGNDLDTVYTLKVEIYNENYGGTPDKPVEIKIPWKIVEAESDPRLAFIGDNMKVNRKDAKDEESIRASIMRNVDNVKHDEAKIDFAYLAESDWDTVKDLDDLDALTPGVPTEDGRYKVFLKYDGKYVDASPANATAEGLDVYEYCYVKIDRSDYYFDFDDTVHSITYGDAVALNDYTVMDYLGEPADVTVDNNGFYYTVYNARSYENEDGEIEYYYNEYDRPVSSGLTSGLLNAYTAYNANYGLYYVEVSGKTTDNKTIAADGFYVRVNKKEVTKQMVGIINRDYANDKTVYVWNPYTEEGKIFANDTFDYIDTKGNKVPQQNKIAMAAVGGTYSAIKPGSYNVQLSIATEGHQTTTASAKDLYDSFTALDNHNLFVTFYTQFDRAVSDAMAAAQEAGGLDDQYTANDIKPADEFIYWYNNAVRNADGDYNAFATTTLTNARLDPIGDVSRYSAEQMATALVAMGYERITADSTMQEVVDAILAKSPVTSVNTDYKNYTIKNRKLTTSWNIISEAGKPDFVEFEDGAYARLFNGGKIHVAVKRPAESGKTVQSFGVIIDKEGKLAAPEGGNDVTAIAAATAELVLGKGYTTSGSNLSAADQEKLTRGANITPTSVDTGVWVRPYYVDNAGVAHYGEPKYFTLPEVTQAELQLRVPGWGNTSAVTRETKKVDDKDVSTGNIKDYEGTDYDYMDNALNKYIVGPVEEVKTKKNAKGVEEEYLNRRIYYVAAVKNTLDKIEDKDDPTMSRSKLTPERFGIILDKNGVVPGAEGEGAEKAYENARAELKVDDKRFKTTTSSNSDNHGENAYGANITPKDVFTGVWVRPYVDFGNGLIVYADPVYFNSFNEYFAKEYGVTFEGKITDTKGNPYNAIGVNQEKTKFEFYYKPVVNDKYAGGKWYNGKNTLTYSAAGVVVDKANSITDFNKLTVAAADGVKVVSGSRTKANIDANETHKGVYGANVKKTDGTINVRPFIVIDENLTLYGPVKSVTFADVDKEAIEYWENLKG